jgi:uncharacterized protein YcbX
MADKWGTVVDLWRYPVSSLGGERIDRTELDAHGILHDRIWGMCDAQTGAISEPESQKRWRFAPDIPARMGQSEPQIRTEQGEWLNVSTETARAAASTRAGFPIAFSPLAQTMAEAGGNTLAPRYDRGHLHILTTASLQALSEMLPPESMVDVRRFRPNIVIALKEPADGFPEKGLIGRSVMIGNAVVEITEPCERCSFTGLAQADLPFAKEVLHAIARHAGGGFGVLARVVAPAPVELGDAMILM